MNDKKIFTQYFTSHGSPTHGGCQLGLTDLPDSAFLGNLVIHQLDPHTPQVDTSAHQLLCKGVARIAVPFVNLVLECSDEESHIGAPIRAHVHQIDVVVAVGRSVGRSLRTA